MRPFYRHYLGYCNRNHANPHNTILITIRYDNAPVYEWDAIQEGIDLPNLQRTFAGIIFVVVIVIITSIIICLYGYRRRLLPGIFGYIVSLLLDPETGDQLLTPFLDLLGVGQWGW